MTSSTRKTKAATITRTISFALVPDSGAVRAVVTEVKALKTTSSTIRDSYIPRRFSSDFGVAVEVAKEYADGEVYNVLLNGANTSCDCKWGTFQPNGKPCRHVALVQEAIEKRFV